MASPVRRSCAIDDHRYVFISLSFEKLLSANATVTGRIQAIHRDIQRFGYNSHESHGCAATGCWEYQWMMWKAVVP